MLWIKALHVIFMVTWFSGLFYLPRLFVYHAMADQSNTQQIETFKVMQRKLLVMCHIGAILTILFGTLLLVIWLPGLMKLGWMHAKLAMVVALLIYHAYCMRLVKQFRENRNTRSHVWFRWFNEVPVLFLFVIIIMVIVRPL